jgi:hypothetical protein
MTNKKKGKKERKKEKTATRARRDKTNKKTNDSCRRRPKRGEKKNKCMLQVELWRLNRTDHNASDKNEKKGGARLKLYDHAH